MASELRKAFIAAGVTFVEIESIPTKGMTCVSRGFATARAKRAAQDVALFGLTASEVGRRYDVSEKQIRKDLHKILKLVLQRREQKQ